MAFKFVMLAAFAACASAGVLPAAPVSYSTGHAIQTPLAYSAGHHAYQEAPQAYSTGYHAYQEAPLAYSTGHHAYQEAPLAYTTDHHAYAAVPVAKAVVAKTVDDEYNPNPQYSYSYDVHDGVTGDAKNQQEVRNGDQVQGSYSIVEADGTRRVVEYTADDHNGFNAVVRKEPVQQAVHAVPVAHHAVHAAPVAHAVVKSHHLAGHEYY